MQIKKINLSDEGAMRQKISEAVGKMNDLVSLTLGPNGRSIIIERGMGEPLIVDDGRRTAENIKFDDELQQLVVRVVYGVTRKTDEKVGDGTTTSMVLTNAIIQDIYKNYLPMTGGIGVSSNVADIDRRIIQSRDEVFKKLDEMKTDIKTEKQLISIATNSVGDPKLGETIGGMYWKLGKDGHITLEFNLLSEEIENEVVPGYRFTGSYAADWMISNALRHTCDLSDVDVLVTRNKITDINEIQPIANQVANSGKNKFVIIAPKFSDSVLKHVYQNATRQAKPYFIMCVRAPGRTQEAYKDMAIYTGGKYFPEGDDLKTATKEDLGYLGRIEVSEDEVVMTEGKGSDKDLKKRVQEVKAEAAMQKVHQLKNDRLERASALGSGVGVIRIGAPTDEERNWLKHKIEDAKYATKQAYRDGIVPGGGMAFKKIASQLSDDNILKTALLAPYETLKRNNGGSLTVPKDVFDPVAVEKAALEHACSATSKLIRIGGGIAMQMPSVVEELGRAVNNNGEGEE